MPPTPRTAAPIPRLGLSAYPYEVVKGDQLTEDGGHLEIRRIVAREDKITFTLEDDSTREYTPNPWPILEIRRDRSLVAGFEDEEPLNADELAPR